MDPERVRNAFKGYPGIAAALFIGVRGACPAPNGICYSLTRAHGNSDPRAAPAQSLRPSRWDWLGRDLLLRRLFENGAQNGARFGPETGPKWVPFLDPKRVPKRARFGSRFGSQKGTKTGPEMGPDWGPVLGPETGQFRVPFWPPPGRPMARKRLPCATDGSEAAPGGDHFWSQNGSRNGPEMGPEMDPKWVPFRDLFWAHFWPRFGSILGPVLGPAWA